MVLAEKDTLRRILRRNAGWVLMVVLVTLSACKEDDRLGRTSLDVSHMPTLSTRNVATVISDSGYTKYKVVTPLWNVYNEVKEPYWDFPEGVYLRQLSRDHKVVSSVAADSAVYVPSKKLWKLFGSVEIDQVDKSYFFSERVFFDDRNHKIYSDTFIHIKTPSQILEGIGFESNLDMTQYRVLKPSGVFPSTFAGEGGGGPGIPSGGAVAIPSMDPMGDQAPEMEESSEEPTE